MNDKKIQTEKAPDILYHYTSLESFLSILKSASFREYIFIFRPDFSENSSLNQLDNYHGNKIYIWNDTTLFYMHDKIIPLEITCDKDFFISKVIIPLQEIGVQVMLSAQMVRLIGSITKGYKPLMSTVVRLMSHKSMNDNSELKVHKENVDEAFLKAKKCYSEKEKEIDEIQIAYSMSTALDAFIFCLSEKPDILTQWRLYADDTYGVALGFSPKEINLRNIDTSDNRHHIKKEKFFPLKVCYEKSVIHQDIEVIVNASITKIEEEHSLVIGGDVFKKTLSFKESSFSSEKEWRYVSCSATVMPSLPIQIPRTQQWIVKNKSLINYIECIFDLNSIKEIYVTPNFKSKDMVYHLIREFGLNAEIKEYETSYKLK